MADVIAHVGSLPVSGVNLGIAAAVPGLSVEVAKLNALIAKLTGGITLQAEIQSSFPPGPTFMLALAGYVTDPVTLALAFATWPTLTVDANADLGVELGVVEAQILIVEALVATLEAGVDSGGLTGWTYAGRAMGFGTRLQAATANGFGTAEPDTQVSAILVACESFASWQAFSAQFNVGDTANTELAAGTTAEDLRCQGTLTGGQWNTGTLTLFARLDALLLELRGLRFSILAQIDIALGLNLPNPTLLLEIAADIDLDVCLDNLVNVSVDLTAEIGNIQLRIDAIAQLILDLHLTAGGLSVWSYTGTAAGLGTAFAAAIADGVPGGSGPRTPVYGVAIACNAPAAWATFGGIFVTE